MPLKALRAEQSSAILALFWLLFCNLPFWQYLWQVQATHGVATYTFMAVLGLLLFLTLNLLLNLLALPYVFKPLMSILLMSTASTVYFMQQYGVMIDKAMIRNALETNPAEARDLVTFKLVAYLGLLGGLPVWLLWRTPIVFRPLRREALIKLLIAGASLAAMLVIALGFYKDFSSLFRNHRELRFLLTPSNYLQAGASLLKKPQPVHVLAIGEDAQRKPGARPSLTVLVVGETARAANFSLNGYGRETNPLLQQIPELINFPDFHSCGTDTATSVPCMFSGLGRADYSDAKAHSRQGLLDILQRTGVAVSWRDNQSGCKGVCDRVPTETVSAQMPGSRCAEGECLDESLLAGLPERIAGIKGDGVIVLHMMGSHGPAYYKRYPAGFEVFKPTCQTSQLDQCTSEQLRNAYDNSLRYTDFVLSKLIAQLRAEAKDRDIAMFYVSDHGESLGERNLYLHGTPYVLAPDYQTHVPALLWLSPAYGGLNAACLRQRAKANYSHDYLFHSVLGLMGVRTALYRPELDFFAPCRKS